MVDDNVEAEMLDVLDVLDVLDERDMGDACNVMVRNISRWAMKQHTAEDFDDLERVKLFMLSR